MKIGSIMQNVLSDLNSLRENEERICEKKLNIALSDSRFNELSVQLAKKTFEYAEQGLSDDAVLTELTNKRNLRISELGLSVDDLSPKYRCPLCHDLGHVDGKLCKCFIKNYYEKLRSILDIADPPSFSFGDFKTTKIANVEQLGFLKALYAVFKKYSLKFPAVNTTNALLMGGTGVGKTCLLSAVYNALAERGFEVIYVTAIELNNILLNYHTEQVSKRQVYLADIISCDALFIDDLGTEQKLRNVTEEYLLKILSLRDTAQKAVFFSTNLNYEQLKENYNERLFSRMANRQTTIIKEIVGDDLRIN